MGYLQGERVVEPERDALWVAFSTKTCPRCGAAPSADCKRSNGTPFAFTDNGYTVHHERRALVVNDAAEQRQKRLLDDRARIAAQQALAEASSVAYRMRRALQEREEDDDMTFVDRYTNVHGEHYAFIQCEGEQDAVIVGSETAWKYVAVVGGRTPLFLLNQGEFDWISACWRASAPLREPAST